MFPVLRQRRSHLPPLPPLRDRSHRCPEPWKTATNSIASGPATDVVRSKKSSASVNTNSKHGTHPLRMVCALFDDFEPRSHLPIDCSNLWLDYYVCVHIPGATTAPSTPKPTTSDPQPQMPGIVSNCNAFYKVQSGDSCYTIDQTNGITLDQFLAWKHQSQRGLQYRQVQALIPSSERVSSPPIA